MSARASALQNLKARRQQTAGSSPGEGVDTPGVAAAAGPPRPAPAAGKGPEPSRHSGQPGHEQQPAQAQAQRPQQQQQPRPPQQQPALEQEPLPTRAVEAFAWVCGTCERECVPVRSESRCLCGHRLKEHGPASSTAPSKCKSAKCGCRNFFYVVAEGAWVLRCRCKHKHVEHDPATRACVKAGCGCGVFDSPWVCNCDHPWSEHRQLVAVKQVISVRDMMGGMSLGEVEVGGGGPAREVNDYNALKRGDLAGLTR